MRIGRTIRHFKSAGMKAKYHRGEVSYEDATKEVFLPRVPYPNRDNEWGQQKRKASGRWTN